MSDALLVVPGRPSSDALTWWVFSPRGVPPQVSLRGVVGGGSPTVRPLGPAGTIAGCAFLVATQGLRADAEYTLDAAAGGVAPGAASSRTLPTSMARGTPFTVSWGSCYCAARDRGLDYPPKAHSSSTTDPVRLRFLTGDQIYMDLDPRNGSSNFLAGAPNPWARYVGQWTAHAGFRSWLSKSPTLLLADDHEFWNDYPHDALYLPWVPSRRGRPPGPEMDWAFSVFQAALNLDAASIAAAPAGGLPALLADSARTFSFDVSPVRFLVLDVRTQRTRYDEGGSGFSHPYWMGKVRGWLQGLTGPGVLVLAQPLVEQPASGFARFTHTMADNNLPDYPRDFATLWEAVLGPSAAATPHDVLVLSGDIHWSRLYQVQDAYGRRMWEATASPLALIPAIRIGPLTFGSPRPGDASGQVRWSGGRAWWSATPQHFSQAHPQTYSTVTFVRKEDAGARVDATVTSWARRPGTFAFDPQVVRTIPLR